MDTPQLPITTRCEVASGVQHGQIVTDQEITLFPSVPISHPTIMQQSVQRRADGGTLLLVDVLALNRHKRRLEFGLALWPGLVVMQHWFSSGRVVQNQWQVAQFRRAKARRRHAPGQRAEVFDRQP